MDLTSQIAELYTYLVRSNWMYIIPLILILVLGIYWLIKELKSGTKLIINFWIKASADAKLIFCGLMIIAVIEFIF